MSQYTYFQNQQGNDIPQQLSLVPIIPIQIHPYPPPPYNIYSGSSTNYSTIPAEYPVTSYNQSNISKQYPPSQTMTPQQMNVVPNVLNGANTTPIQYQPINPIPSNQQDAFQPYTKPTYIVGTPNVIMIPMEQNKCVQGNLSNQIQFANPTTNQQNIVQYNIFPQAINSFNSGNQSFAPNGMNLANNVDINNGQILHRENIMNQNGENKNNINTNSGLQNLGINNDNKNVNSVPVVPLAPVVPVEAPGVPVGLVKKVQFECPICHEEYNREEFFSGRKKKNDFVYDTVHCKDCNDRLDYDEYCFKCDICHSYFCDNCTLKKS